MKNYQTVKLYLFEGIPNGAKKIQVSNWSGLAFLIPRNRIKVVDDRDEFKKQCLYFLVSDLSGDPEVYIGEAENFQKRISQHNRNSDKDFWNICIVFMSKDENLSKAHVKYLEATFISDCRIANRAKKLHNRNNPEGSRLPEEDCAEMEAFKEYVKLVLSSIGYTFHENVKSEDRVIDKYHIKVGDYVTEGIRNSEGMIIIEGSKIAKKELDENKYKLWTEYRNKYLVEQSIKDDGDYYLVMKNIAFSSVSTAAGFVQGRNANGWKEWKNDNGKTLDEIERKSMKASG